MWTCFPINFDTTLRDRRNKRHRLGVCLVIRKLSSTSVATYNSPINAKRRFSLLHFFKPIVNNWSSLSVCLWACVFVCYWECVQRSPGGHVFHCDIGLYGIYDSSKLLINSTAPFIRILIVRISYGEIFIRSVETLNILCAPGCDVILLIKWCVSNERHSFIENERFPKYFVDFYTFS